MEYDAVVIGGGFAGSAAALLLRRECPDSKIAIVDRTREFTRKVGESATELSSWFLTQVLDLDRHLALEHLPKYGLRFWFANESVEKFEDASELGNRYQSRVPGMHVERAALDRHVFGLAKDEGVDILRPETVAELDLGQPSTITLGSGKTITAKWVIDATGRRAMIARQLGLFHPMPEHPIRAEWWHYKDLRDFDEDRLPGTVCSRGLSTNHLTGHGWWVWFIPLPGGEVSVGLVWDERLTERPDWESTPLAKEILKGATRTSDKAAALRHLPYRVTQHIAPGWALVGDAAGFLDPLYSPGLDFASMTVTRVTQLVARSLRGEDVTRCMEKHNRYFTKGVMRWFKALFLDKYHYVGDFELMRIALRLDTAGYYIGVVRPAYKHGTKAVPIPFGTPPSLPFYWFMRFVNRRMVKLAKKRKHLPRNAGRRDLMPGFSLGLSSLRYFPWALGALLKMEVKTLWARVFARGA